jgi:hypothetical protein
MTPIRLFAAWLLGMSMWLSSAAQPAPACSCASGQTPAAALADATRVFRGTVEAIERPQSSFALNSYRFSVDEVWKGEVSPVISVASGNSATICGFNFVEGMAYLVYVDSSGSTTLCDRTRVIANAGADLVALGSGRTPEVAPASVVARHLLFSGAWFDPERNGEGVIVQVLPDGSASVYWFGYRGLVPREQTWLVGVGQFDGDVLRVVPVHRPIGGGFGASYTPGNVELVQWGELLLTFQADGILRMRWTSTIPEYGSGTLNLRRLTRTPAIELP